MNGEHNWAETGQASQDVGLVNHYSVWSSALATAKSVTIPISSILQYASIMVSLLLSYYSDVKLPTLSKGQVPT